MSIQPSDLDGRIVDLVQEHWGKHGMPLLLSLLGSEGGGEIGRLAKQEAGGLGAYLRHRLTDRVRVIHHSTKPMVAGAIPVDAEVDANAGFDRLLEKTHSRSSGADPRIHSAFLAAFREPLDESKGRYTSIRAPFRFVDVSSEERPDGFREIAREYVAGPDAEAMEVQQKAQDWLAANGLDPDRFLWKDKADVARLPSNDLLGRLLLSLEPDELKRISMPLDVVGKLRRQSL